MKPAGVAAIAALTLMPSTGTTRAAEPGDLLWKTVSIRHHSNRRSPSPPSTTRSSSPDSWECSAIGTS